MWPKRETGAGAGPEQFLESGPSSPGCDLEEGKTMGSSWVRPLGPWTPHLWGAAQLEHRDRVFQSLGATARVPLAWDLGIALGELLVL